MKKIIAVALMLFASNVYAEKVVVIPMFDEVEAANWSGDWASDTKYKVDDIAQYDGSSYVAIADHTSDLSNYPPDDAYWNLVSAAGVDGGVDGAPGEDGTDGVDGVNGATMFPEPASLVDLFVDLPKTDTGDQTIEVFVKLHPKVTH